MNILSQGDCLQLLREVDSESVDVTFADPPFNLGKKYPNNKDNLSEEHYLEWSETWIREMVRVTKPTGSIFIHNIPKWLIRYAPILNQIADFKHWIAWDAMSSPMGKKILQPNHYGILWYAKDAKQNKFYRIRHPHKCCRKCKVTHKDYGGKVKNIHPFGPLVSDVWTDIHRVRHQKNRDDHPCQLPIQLLERIILMSTDEDDVVLDPFMGTGTTLIAASKLNREYIGFELSEPFKKIAFTNVLMTKRGQNEVGCEVYAGFKGNRRNGIQDILTLRDCDWDYIRNIF
jgi:site-specific DNA-methyltransferase (adenine-specific)